MALVRKITRMDKKLIALVIIALLVGVVGGYVLGFSLYQPALVESRLSPYFIEYYQSINLSAYGPDDYVILEYEIAGYRQVSVYIGGISNLDYFLSVRIGMGNFSKAGIAGYWWTTYSYTTELEGHNPSLRHTIDVRGPELRIEVSNHKSYPVEIRVAIYVTG